MKKTRLIQMDSTRAEKQNSLFEKYESLFVAGIGKLDMFVCRLHIKKKVKTKVLKT